MQTPTRSCDSSQDEAESSYYTRQQRRDHANQMQALVDEYRESAPATASQAQYEAAGGLIYLACVDHSSGRRVFIRAVRSRRFKRMREALEEQFGPNVSMRYRGRLLQDHETPADVDMPHAPTKDRAVTVEIVRR